MMDPREDLPADTEKELLMLMGPKSHPSIKGMALQHLLGMTGTAEGRTFINERGKLFSALLDLTFDADASLKKEAQKCVINLTAEESGVNSLVGLKDSATETTAKMLQQCLDTDQVCMLTLSILNNLTRVSDGADIVAKVVVETESLGLKRLVDAVSVLYEKKAPTLGATCQLLMNLTQVPLVRQALMMPPDHLLNNLLALMSLSSSSSLASIKGIVGAVKNCCFEYEFHTWLLNEENVFLARVLLPLAGPEEFDEADMDRLPLELQYLPSDKVREPDAEVRLMLVQTVHKLCSTKAGRLYLKDKNVYVIMRELHKAETNEENFNEIMNVIDILIGDEPKEGMEDLHKVDVPSHLTEKFEQEDKEEEKATEKASAS